MEPIDAEQMRDSTEIDCSRREFLKRCGCAVASATAVSRCGGTTTATRPNVVLLIADTLRRDHVSCYGYDRKTTPFLDSLAERSTLCEHAYSTSCWTFPSHASLFTGLYPSAHHATWEHFELSSNLVTLAQALGESGYSTTGLTTNGVISPGTGFERGFDSYEWKLHEPGWKEHAGLGALRSALDDKGEAPFFFFCNLMEAHDPYDSSEQYFGNYLTDPAYKDDVSLKIFESLANPDEYIYDARIKHLTEHYDAEIRYVDHVMGHMAQLLQSAGVWNNTLFIVTSDHGEHLGEHGLVEHQFSLYEEAIRIPLILHYPGVFESGAREKRMVQLTDIFPTVLDAARIDYDVEAVQGASLLSAPKPKQDQIVLCEYALHPIFGGSRLFGQQPGYPELPNVQRHNRRLKALRHGPFKLIRGDDGYRALYDVEQDAREQRDLKSEQAHKETLERMGRLLDATVERVERALPPTRAALTQKDVELLEGLGYLK